MTDVRVHVLALHAAYRCRHAGVCCREPWAIPVEALALGRLQRALDTGLLRPEQPAKDCFEAAGEAVVVGRTSAACVFFEPARGRLCAIHRTLGHAALPSACQHFPRVVTIDPRGVFVSLSHVCPTAGKLLLAETPMPFSIVHSGSVVLPGIVWAGLDARDSLPPQVSDAVLWDWDGLSAWERRVLDQLERGGAERALATAMHAARSLERWTPRTRTRLADAVRLAFDAGTCADEGPADVIDDLDALARQSSISPRAATLDGATRRDVDATLVAPAWSTLSPIVSRYLASRAVAAAVTYHASRAKVLASWLWTAYSVLRVEAARHAADASRLIDADLLVAAAADADRLLVHRADAARLASMLSSAAW